MTKNDNRQMDMFVALVGDIPTRDQRETMERPFFSLQKTPRTTPIDYSSGSLFVKVIPHPDYGMASIWDADVLIWAASQITEAKNKGLPHGPTIRFHPYELLKAIHRHTGGDQYQKLRAALDRLRFTTVKTNIRVPNGKKSDTFGWLDAWGEEVNDEGCPKSMYITLPQWLYQGIVMRGGVLKIADAYFDITSGLERWLYLVARKHGGHQEDGWTFALATLHHKSGVTRELKKFAAEVRAITQRNALPEYTLALVTLDGGEEGIRVLRRPVDM